MTVDQVIELYQKQAIENKRTLLERLAIEKDKYLRELITEYYSIQLDKHIDELIKNLDKAQINRKTERWMKANQIGI